MNIGLRQLVSAVFLMTFFASSVMAGPGDQEAAIRVANEWLLLVDAGRFSESWEHSSSVFRETVPAAMWQESLAVVREPLGTLISRKVVFSRYTDSLRGAPERRYVIIQSEAQYEGNKSAIETVMPLYDDGEWRVSGYFIRQRPTVPPPQVPMVGSGEAAD